MTNDEIKKALECCSNQGISYCKDCPYANYGEFDCCNGKMYKDVLTLITEQEKSLQEAQDSILSVAQQNQEYREQQVKQAKIDVLNKLKSSAVYDDNYLDGYVFIDDVNKLIEEVENGEDKG